MTIQVLWNQAGKFQNIIVHPARMYIIVILSLNWNRNEIQS